MTAFSPPLKLTADQWKMPGPRPRAIPLPVRVVFLHHTVTEVTTDPLADAHQVAAIGLARFGQVSYSVLVHPGRVIFWAQLEHRGAHTKSWNSRSLGIALIGDYERGDVPDELVHDACVALADLRKVGLVVAEPLVMPHNSVSHTACPGAHAMAKVLPLMRAVAADPSWSG